MNNHIKSLKNCQLSQPVLKKYKRMGIETNDNKSETFDEPLKSQLYDHLLNSELFSVYRSAFEKVTAHTVALVHPDVDQTPKEEIKRCSNDYCSILRETQSCSKRCLSHTINLSKKAFKTSNTAICEGGLTSSLIPIHSDQKVVAYLRTGQVKLSVDSISKEKIHQLQEDLPDSVAQDLSDAFAEMTNFDEKKYVNQLVVLGAFSLQLATLAEKSLQSESSESILTNRCKQYISKHLREKICLDELAEHTKVTNSYMCKQFKKHTGMTIVEYINVHRINIAKKRLLESSVTKVIEIAYDCGFQSLSQFNRTFQKFVGDTPSSYRKGASGCISGTCTPASV